MNLIRYAYAAGAVTLFGALAACSGDPEPIIADPTSDSVQSTPPPTSAAATTTSAPQNESAKEFVIRWQTDVAIKMQHTGDTTEYRALSNNCESCDDIADLIEEIYSSGGHAIGGESRITKITQLQVDGPTHIIAYTLKAEPTQYTRRARGKTLKLAGGIFTYEISVTKRNNAWSVEYLDRTS